MPSLKTFSTFFISISIGLSAFAKTAETGKYALVLGAGGEPEGDTTIFDNSVKVLGQKLHEADYKTQIAYNGGHKKSILVISESFAQKPDDFTMANTKKLLKNLEGKIGKTIHTGDQILIVVDTHGQPVHPGAVHDVYLSDDVENSSGKTLDLKEFQGLQKLTEAHGVRLAILDMSCYSGQSLILARKAKNTCVITAAPATEMGYTSFTDNLYAGLQKGQSLESTYLNARNKATYSFPQISTAPGMAAEEWMKYLDAKVTASNSDLFLSPDQADCAECKDKAHPFGDLEKLLTKASGTDQASIDAFKLATDQYIKIRQEYLDDNDYANTSLDFEGSSFQLVSFINIDSTIQNFKELIEDEDDPKVKKGILNLISKEPAFREKREELLKSDEHFRKLVARYGKQKTMDDDDMNSELAQASYRVSLTERKIYQQIYLNAAKEQIKTSSDAGLNVCQDFKF